MTAAKKYIKKYNKIAVILKEICPPVTSSEDFKNQLLSRIEAELRAANSSYSSGESDERRTIRIIVYIASDVLSGHIAIPKEERLSDFLNSPSQFVKLTGVMITRRENKHETLSEIYINKEAIKMIRTMDKNTARGTGPAITKIPVRTFIHMPDYELDGILHCKTSESVSQLLETDNTFLPCTTVNVRDIHTNSLFHTNFTAINRKLVSALHQAQ